jgi:hypothetical protein
MTARKGANTKVKAPRSPINTGRTWGTPAKNEAGENPGTMTLFRISFVAKIAPQDDEIRIRRQSRFLTRGVWDDKLKEWDDDKKKRKAVPP